MDITINQTFAKIGMDTTKSSLEMRSSPAKLELHQNHARLSISTEKPKIMIDQYECFASSGLKNDMDLLLKAKQKAYQQVMSFIQKTAEDGKRLRAIEDGGNVIASIAKRDAFPTNEFGMVVMPATGPEITLVEGSIKIDLASTNNGLKPAIEGNYLPGWVNMKYNPNDVNIYMLQEPSIEIVYQKD